MNSIAVEGFLFEIKQSGFTISGVVQTLPSENVFIDGKKVYAGDTTVLLQSIDNGTYAGTMISFVLKPSGENVLADGKKVLLENDESDVTDVELKLIASPYTPQHFNLNLYVKDSGQTNVEVE